MKTYGYLKKRNKNLASELEGLCPDGVHIERLVNGSSVLTELERYKTKPGDSIIFYSKETAFHSVADAYKRIRDVVKRGVSVQILDEMIFIPAAEAVVSRGTPADYMASKILAKMKIESDEWVNSIKRHYY